MSSSSSALEFYDPKAFRSITHRIGWIKLTPIVQDSLLQTPGGAWIFVSIPMWLSVLTNQLKIIDLVGFTRS